MGFRDGRLSGNAIDDAWLDLGLRFAPVWNAVASTRDPWGFVAPGAAGGPRCVEVGASGALQVTADQNGLLANDIVVAVGGKRFKTFAEYGEYLRDETTRPTARLTLLRAGKTLNLDVAVTPRPPDVTDTYETVYDEVLSNGHRVRTFVTRPESPGKHPVFFYIQGINLGSIDFPLTGKSYISSLGCGVLRMTL